MSTFALGIGANTALFSYLNAVLFRPLPYQDPERLVVVSEGGGGHPRLAVLEEWRKYNQVFADMAAASYFDPDLNLTDGQQDRAEHIRSKLVTANYFNVLGVSALVGRTFLPHEDQPGNEAVIVLSHRLWRRAFGADPGIVGRTILLDGNRYLVAGVLPAGAFDRDGAEVWLPFAPQPFIPGREAAGGRRSLANYGAPLFVVARLKPRVTIEQARVEMDRVATWTQGVQTGTVGRSGSGCDVRPLRDRVVSPHLRRALAVLMGGVCFLLLIACGNGASMILARAAAREREVALRLALGAARLRLVRQFLAESTTISLLGGALGCLLAFWLVPVARVLIPVSELPREAEVQVDFRVLIFTVGVSCVAGLLAGLAPVLHYWTFGFRGGAARADLSSGLKGGGERLRRALLVGQVALVFTLATGAGLLLKSFARLMAVDTGMRTENLLTFRTVLPEGRYPHGPQILSYVEALESRVKSLPQVRGVSACTLPAGPGALPWVPFRIEDQPGTGAIVSGVTPEYFSTVGARLLRGRWFSRLDSPAGPPLAVINRSFASAYFAGRETIGQRIFLPMTGTQVTIAGVVADIQMLGLKEKFPPLLYLPLPQLLAGPRPWARTVTFLIRTNESPMQIASSVQQIAAGVDKSQPVFAIQSMERILEDTVPWERCRAVVLGAFGFLGLTLMTAGVYGVLSYSVVRRTQEIGVRMALGARPDEVLGMVLWRGMSLVAAGVLLGLGGALALTRLLKGFLFEVTPLDPATFAVVAGVVLALAIAASAFPAYRAARIDPMLALRSE